MIVRINVVSIIFRVEFIFLSIIIVRISVDLKKVNDVGLINF